MIRPKKLIYKDVNGAGKQIFADLDVGFNFAEYSTKKGLKMIATEPWIQFEQKEYTEMMNNLFSEMVDCWNEKHAKENK